jgi:hypothetical protein
VRNAERVDMAVEGIGDAAHMPADAEGSSVEIDGQCIAHLRDASAVQTETLVVGASRQRMAAARGAHVDVFEQSDPAEADRRIRDHAGRRADAALGPDEQLVLAACVSGAGGWARVVRQDYPHSPR